MRAILFLIGIWTVGCFPRVGYSEWVDARRHGQFRIHAEFKLDQIDPLLDTIQEQRADIAATLDLQPGNSPIVICLFSSYSSYIRYIRQHAPAGINRRALFVSGETAGFVYVYRHPGFETDLRHEVTHAILHSMLPFLPLWLDEGLAEYFEVRSAKRTSSNPHQLRMKWASRLGWKPDLKRLEGRNNLSEFSMADYRESWAWVHFLLHGPDDAGQLLRNYLATIQQETPPGPFSRHLTRAIPDPGRQLTAHLRKWR